jgi:hypothetical protein
MLTDKEFEDKVVKEEIEKILNLIRDNKKYQEVSSVVYHYDVASAVFKQRIEDELSKLGIEFLPVQKSADKNRYLIIDIGE